MHGSANAWPPIPNLWYWSLVMLMFVGRLHSQMFEQNVADDSNIKRDPNVFVRNPADPPELSQLRTNTSQSNETAETPVNADNSQNSPILQQAIELLNRFNPPGTRFNLTNKERDEHFAHEFSRQFYSQLYRLLGSSYRDNLSHKEMVEQIEVQEVFNYAAMLSMPAVVTGGLLVVLGYIALILIYIWQHRRLQRQIKRAVAGKGALALASTSASAATKMTPAIGKVQRKGGASSALSALKLAPALKETQIKGVMSQSAESKVILAIKDTSESALAKSSPEYEDTQIEEDASKSALSKLTPASKETQIKENISTPEKKLIPVINETHTQKSMSTSAGSKLTPPSEMTEIEGDTSPPAIPKLIPASIETKEDTSTSVKTKPTPVFKKAQTKEDISANRAAVMSELLSLSKKDVVGKQPSELGEILISKRHPSSSGSGMASLPPRTESKTSLSQEMFQNPSAADNQNPESRMRPHLEKISNLDELDSGPKAQKGDVVTINGVIIEPAHMV